MLVWLNGTFGVGKTTIARSLVQRTNRWRLYDPESVGCMLKTNLTDRRFGDFQHLSAWRRLVPLVARQLSEFTGQDLIAVQTVLVRDYWMELRRGLHEQGLDVFHVVLDATEHALRARIAQDEEMRRAIEAGTLESGAQQWRIDHISRYCSSRLKLLTS